MIYIVEDDANIREMMLYTLGATGFKAEGFESAEPFFKRLEAEKPRLVLLDLMLPGMGGAEVLKRLKAAYPKMPVILVTAKSTQMDKIKGLDGGADDYITKPFDIMELVSRVKAVLRRCPGVGEADMLTYKDLKLDVSGRKVSVGEADVALTYKEFELLHFLLINKGRVFSRDKLMNEVWGVDFEGETRTVDVHIRTLRQKLGSAGEYIETVRNVGYKIS